MKNKTVPFETCSCGKRAFENRRLADKAMGRARAKRERLADKAGSRRGLDRENRTYICPESGLLHLTGQSRREFQQQTEPTYFIPSQRGSVD